MCVPADLERDLGLYATITVSIGAMLGSGIFVLPGLAAAKAGPAVVLAYFLAGLVALPAALSKSEMATAIPEAGGTYLYIDRAMGPFAGTIAGVGSWFSLVFKSAFAIVGLGAYLVLFIELTGIALDLVGVGIALALLAVNILGVKQTGRLQAAIVTLVLLVLVVFIADGITFVDGARYHPFFGDGAIGLLEATGFVFVSYAGVTKIASVAEEVENPGRNIPASILGSVVFMMFVYTFVVFVVVGVTPAFDLADNTTPMAEAASRFLGPAAIGVTLVAILALTSMSNAGILASARFPLAMARDSLAPSQFAAISERFNTPVNAIGITGLVLVLLITIVPVENLAKLASAFKLLIFSLVNAAVIAFRESELEWYDPAFQSPGYPWVQIAGIVAGLALLPFMGVIAIGGAVGIVVTGTIWYRIYGRERTEREGAALDAIRRSAADTSVETVEGRLADTERTILVTIGPETDVATETRLLTVGEQLARYSSGSVHAVRFSAVPDQVPLSRAAEQRSRPESGPRETGLLLDDADVEATVDEVVTHDPRHALRTYVEEHDIDLVIGEWVPDHFHGELLGEDVDWYMRGIEADLMFVRDRGREPEGEILAMTAGSPFDPLQVVAADAYAVAHDLDVRFIYALNPDASDEQRQSVGDYLDALAGQSFAPARTEQLVTDDPVTELAGLATRTDLVILRTEAHNLLYDVVIGTVPDAVADRVQCTVLLAHTSEPRRHTFLRYVLERLVY